MARYLLWIGVPVGYFLLSCCCCIFCCCSGVAKGEEKESRLRESELADLSRGFPDDVDATSEMEEEAPALHASRAGRSVRRGLGRGWSSTTRLCQREES